MLVYVCGNTKKPAENTLGPCKCGHCDLINLDRKYAAFMHYLRVQTKVRCLWAMIFQSHNSTCDNTWNKSIAWNCQSTKATRVVLNIAFWFVMPLQKNISLKLDVAHVKMWQRPPNPWDNVTNRTITHQTINGLSNTHNTAITVFMLPRFFWSAFQTQRSSYSCPRI